MTKNLVLLVIIDGFGISLEKKGNAVYLAKKPNLEYISKNYPGTTLMASGLEVGLSWGEAGSSEVGHANIGAGTVVFQNLERINLAIEDKTFFKLPAWKRSVDHANKNGSDIHIMGMVSNGGVHSHIEHLFAILETIKKLKFKGNVFIHVFTDGQDVSPDSALKYIELLENKIEELEIGQIASIMGRYYAMDKGENWDRTKRAYDCLVGGIGNKAFSLKEVIDNSYKKNIKDEHIEPTNIVDEASKPTGLIKDKDVLIYFHFRADRTRQLTGAFVFDIFSEFKRKKLANLLFIPLTQYGTKFPLEPAFSLQYIKNPLVKVISDAGKIQFHIAEKEKYAHVTYFFNGGREEEFKGEDRAIIPSKNVAGYELAPEMSAYEITERVLSEIKKQQHDFIVVNFANADIVGHTGNLKSAIKAIEVIDECLGKIMKEVLKINGAMLITADHGNVEEMINLETEGTDKEHSVNPVPFWIIRSGLNINLEDAEDISPKGILADVAPTILDLMNLPKPKEMTGTSLLHIASRCPVCKSQ